MACKRSAVRSRLAPPTILKDKEYYIPLNFLKNLDYRMLESKTNLPTPTKGGRVIIGLSGGVDSSVSAWLLQQKGYEVQGLFMKNWEKENSQAPCTAAQDLADAQAVCDRLGIVLHTVNFSEEYWEEVFCPFLSEYQDNRTPNPDILCNKAIKFNHFLHYARGLGADYIATGHYAEKQTLTTQYQLHKSRDLNKDQTYFLYTLNQTQLAQTLFPLSQLTKPQVRQLAATLGLPNHAKKDSVGICFIGKRPFKNFLQRYLPMQPGPIQTLEGQTLGQHEGLMYYTLGQRRGLKIGGKKGFHTGPWYVVSKEVPNILRVAEGPQHPALYADKLLCTHMSWVAGTPPTFPLSCTAKIRYRQVDVPGKLSELSPSLYQLQFKSPQRAITPGQSVVLYQSHICLGGGIIESRQ